MTSTITQRIMEQCKEVKTMNTPMNYKKKAKSLNDRTYTDFYYRLMLMARSVFQWDGLPNNIDEKWIERYLYHEGCCMFYDDANLGFMVAKTAYSDHLNEYDEPTELRPIYANYRGDTIKGYKTGKECVLIRNNDIMYPTAPTIELFALRLTEIQRSIDININAMKTPVLLKCTEKQRLSLKNVFEQWNGFEPVIFGDKTLDTGEIGAIKMDAPIVFDKLQIHKKDYWNECMTFMGINNANMDKRERLVDDEVQANNEQIALSASVMLKSRQLACDQINRLYGDRLEKPVTVKIRESVREQFEKLATEGGIING